MDPRRTDRRPIEFRHPRSLADGLCIREQGYGDIRRLHDGRPLIESFRYWHGPGADATRRPGIYRQRPSGSAAGCAEGNSFYGLALSGFCIGAFLFGDEALRIFYGSQYDGNSHTITVLSVSILASALSMPAASSLLVLERPDVSLKASATGLLITMTVASALVFPLGVLGWRGGFYAVKLEPRQFGGSSSDAWQLKGPQDEINVYTSTGGSVITYELIKPVDGQTDSVQSRGLWIPLVYVYMLSLFTFSAAGREGPSAVESLDWIALIKLAVRISAFFVLGIVIARSWHQQRRQALSWCLLPWGYTSVGPSFRPSGLR